MIICWSLDLIAWYGVFISSILSISSSMWFSWFRNGFVCFFFFFNYYYYDDNKNISCFSLLWYTEMSVEQVDLEDGWAKLKVFICELIARVNAGKQPYFVDEFKTNWTYNALSSSLLLVLFFNFSCLSRWFVLLYV